MTAFPETHQTDIVAMSDPPPYAIHHLSSPALTPPGSPIQTKTVLVPPPTPPPATSQVSHAPITLPTTTAPAAAKPVELRTLDSRDPLSTCDARFADLILEQVILPRLRVGVLRWKDRESFEFVPQTKDDVQPLFAPPMSPSPNKAGLF